MEDSLLVSFHLITFVLTYDSKHFPNSKPFVYSNRLLLLLFESLLYSRLRYQKSQAFIRPSKSAEHRKLKKG